MSALKKSLCSMPYGSTYTYEPEPMSHFFTAPKGWVYYAGTGGGKWRHLHSYGGAPKIWTFGYRMVKF